VSLEVVVVEFDSLLFVIIIIFSYQSSDNYENSWECWE